MKKEFKIGLVTISILSGISNLLLLGFSIGLSSGHHELTLGATIEHISFWSSMIHLVVSSWLFITLNIFGRIVAIITSMTASLAPILIIANEFSTLWFVIIVCFAFTALIHAIILTKTKKANTE